MSTCTSYVVRASRPTKWGQPPERPPVRHVRHTPLHCIVRVSTTRTQMATPPFNVYSRAQNNHALKAAVYTHSLTHQVTTLPRRQVRALVSQLAPPEARLGGPKAAYVAAMVLLGEEGAVGAGQLTAALKACRAAYKEVSAGLQAGQGKGSGKEENGATEGLCVVLITQGR